MIKSLESKARNLNPLARSQPEYRAVFEHVTQLALEYLASLDDRPSFPDVTGSETEVLFSSALSEAGIGIAALDELASVIDGVRPGGPRFFGYVMGSENRLLPLPICWPACSTKTSRLGARVLRR
jgi:hypothetical protein